MRARRAPKLGSAQLSMAQPPGPPLPHMNSTRAAAVSRHKMTAFECSHFINTSKRFAHLPSTTAATSHSSSDACWAEVRGKGTHSVERSGLGADRKGGAKGASVSEFEIEFEKWLKPGING